MAYNLTQIASNSSDILGFVQGTSNVLTFGWLFILILIGLSVVFYQAFIYLTNDVGKSLSASSFIIFILTILLVAVDLIQNPLVIFITLIISAATIAFTWKRGV